MKLSFLDELLEESAKADAAKRIEMSKIRCDHALQTIAVLENRIAEIENLADQERVIIDEWSNKETAKLQGQIDWLARQLEAYVRSGDEKTINLSHGSIYLRQGKPKVDVIDMEAFMQIAEKKGLLRTKPSEKLPDLNAIHNYIRAYKLPPPGCSYTPATTNFHYKTKGKNDESKTEVGAPVERSSEAEVIA